MNNIIPSIIFIVLIIGIILGIIKLIKGKHKYLLIAFIPSLIWALGVFMITIQPGRTQDILFIAFIFILFPVSGIMALLIRLLDKVKNGDYSKKINKTEI